MPAVLSVGVICFLILLAGWVGYPLWLASRAKRTTHAPIPVAVKHQPCVSVVIATRDHPAVVSERVANLLSSIYAHERLELVVAVDYSAQWRLEDYEREIDGRAVIVRGRAPGGKALALNAGVRASKGEVIVFADSAQTFQPETIDRLVSGLAAPTIGAVSGYLTFGSRSDGVEPLEAFWDYELELRRKESAVHSLVAVTGAVYAIKRELWTDLPPGLICDDLFVPLSIVRQGYRVTWCEQARAHDPRKFSRRQEFARKVRTLTGMLQYCVLVPSSLAPRTNPVWVQFVCHKLLRIATPFLFSGVVFAFFAIAIQPEVVIVSAVLTTVLAVGCFLLLCVAPTRARELLRNVAWAIALLYAPVVATMHAARGKWDVWSQR